MADKRGKQTLGRGQVERAKPVAAQEPQPTANASPLGAQEARTFDFIAEGFARRGVKFYEHAVLPVLRTAAGGRDDLAQLALELCSQALPAFRKAGDRKGEAKTLLNTAWAYGQLGDLPQA